MSKITTHVKNNKIWYEVEFTFRERFLYFVKRKIIGRVICLFKGHMQVKFEKRKNGDFSMEVDFCKECFWCQRCGKRIVRCH